MAPAGRLTDQAQYPHTRPRSTSDRSTRRYDVRGSESRNVFQLSWNGLPSCCASGTWSRQALARVPHRVG